jgi:transposase
MIIGGNMAFVRTMKIRSSSGAVHEYLRVVENIRRGGKVRQKVIANLGNVIALRKDVRQIVNGLLRVCGEKGIHFAEDGRLISTKEYGVRYVAEAVWEELRLSEVIREHLKGCGANLKYEQWVKMMVVNKLSDPTSKLGIFRWLSSVYWPEHGFDGRVMSEELSKEDELKILKGEVMKFYRAMDHLLMLKEELERHLYFRLRDLFSLKVDLVFYDLTSSYFEGEGPEGFAVPGYSRDHEPGKNQVVVGLIMCNGMPIGHEVFEGNRVDKKTVKEVLSNLKKRFQIERCIFVGDRGLVTRENLEEIERHGFDSILALRKRRNEEIKEIVLSKEPFKYHQESKELEWYEVKGGDGLRYIVCRNPSVAAEQKEKRQEALAMLRRDLDLLIESLRRSKKGYTVKTIVRRVEDILRHKHGRRLIDYKVDEKNHCFTYWFKEDSLKLEEAIDGVYILRTKEWAMEPLKVIEAYKYLTEVERAFRTMKSVLDLRPFWHWKEERVRAHALICYLAFLIERYVQRALKTSHADFSAIHAFESLKHLGAAEMKIDDERYFYIGESTHRQLMIFKALNIKPPTRCIVQKQ